MRHIGGVRLALLLAMPNIVLNSGKKHPLRMLHYVTWAMFLPLVTQAQVICVQRMTTCLGITI